MVHGVRQKRFRADRTTVGEGVDRAVHAARDRPPVDERGQPVGLGQSGRVEERKIGLCGAIDGRLVDDRAVAPKVQVACNTVRRGQRYESIGAERLDVIGFEIDRRPLVECDAVAGFARPAEDVRALAAIDNPAHPGRRAGLEEHVGARPEGYVPGDRAAIRDVEGTPIGIGRRRPDIADDRAAVDDRPTVREVDRGQPADRPGRFVGQYAAIAQRDGGRPAALDRAAVGDLQGVIIIIAALHGGTIDPDRAAVGQRGEARHPDCAGTGAGNIRTGNIRDRARIDDVARTDDRRAAPGQGDRAAVGDRFTAADRDCRIIEAGRIGDGDRAAIGNVGGPCGDRRQRRIEIVLRGRGQRQRAGVGDRQRLCRPRGTHGQLVDRPDPGIDQRAIGRRDRPVQRHRPVAGQPDRGGKRRRGGQRQRRGVGQFIGETLEPVGQRQRRAGIGIDPVAQRIIAGARIDPADRPCERSRARACQVDDEHIVTATQPDRAGHRATRVDEHIVAGIEAEGRNQVHGTGDLPGVDDRDGRSGAADCRSIARDRARCGVDQRAAVSQRNARGAARYGAHVDQSPARMREPRGRTDDRSVVGRSAETPAGNRRAGTPGRADRPAIGQRAIDDRSPGPRRGDRAAIGQHRIGLHARAAIGGDRARIGHRRGCAHGKQAGAAERCGDRPLVGEVKTVGRECSNYGLPVGHERCLVDERAGAVDRYTGAGREPRGQRRHRIVAQVEAQQLEIGRQHRAGEHRIGVDADRQRITPRSAVDRSGDRSDPAGRGIIARAQRVVARAQHQIAIDHASARVDRAVQSRPGGRDDRPVDRACIGQRQCTAGADRGRAAPDHRVCRVADIEIAAGTAQRRSRAARHDPARVDDIHPREGRGERSIAASVDRSGVRDVGDRAGDTADRPGRAVGDRERAKARLVRDHRGARGTADRAGIVDRGRDIAIGVAGIAPDQDPLRARHRAARCDRHRRTGRRIADLGGTDDAVIDRSARIGICTYRRERRAGGYEQPGFARPAVDQTIDLERRIVSPTDDRSSTAAGAHGRSACNDDATIVGCNREPIGISTCAGRYAIGDRGIRRALRKCRARYEKRCHDCARLQRAHAHAPLPRRHFPDLHAFPQ